MPPSVNPPFATQEELLQGSKRAYRLVYGLVGNTAIADDILQQAWVKALERPPRKTGSISGWWSMVVRNLVVDWFRRERPVSSYCEQSTDGSTPVQVDPGQEAVRAEASYVLLGAVKNLTEPYRTAITLHYLDGLPVSEVGRRMGVPASTIRTQLMRGRQRLETTLEARMGGNWKAMVLGAFPVQHLLPAGAAKLAAAAESARTGVTLQATQSVVVGKSGASIAALFGLALLATSSLLWVLLSEQTPWAPDSIATEVQVPSGDHVLAQAEASARTQAADGNMKAIASPLQAVQIKDPAGLIKFPVEIHAYRVQQQMRGPALDAPADSFMMLEEKELQFNSLSFELPGAALGQTWIYDLQAGGVASERLISQSATEQALVWEPELGRDYRVQVLDQGGFPIQNACVFAGEENATSSNHPVKWAQSDSAGWVTFSNLPAEELRFMASHENAGFIDLSESNAKQQGQTVSHPIISMRLGSAMADDFDIKQTLSAVFPFGTSPANSSSFLTLLAEYFMNPNRLQLANLGEQPEDSEGLFLATASVMRSDGEPARRAFVVLELQDHSSAWAKTNADGELKIYSAQSIQKLAVLGEQGFVRVDEPAPVSETDSSQDFGVLFLSPYETADVILPADNSLGSPDAGLFKARIEMKRPFGPNALRTTWAGALMQASQLLGAEFVKANQIRFYAPGADLLGSAWVQFPGYSRRIVELMPGQATALEWRPWQDLQVHFTAPVGEIGERFELEDDAARSMFVGEKFNPIALWNSAELQADLQTLVFQDLAPGSYSIFAAEKFESRIRLATFEVTPGMSNISLIPPQMGTLSLVVPESWKGASWIRITPVLAAGEKIVGALPRSPLGWDEQTLIDLPEGQYSMIAQRSGSAPVHRRFVIEAGRVTEEQLLDDEPLHQFRIQTSDQREVRRVLIVLDGLDRKLSWLFRRACNKLLPPGGVLANRSFADKYPVMALVLEVDRDGCFEFRGHLERNFKIFALDVDQIWSRKVSMTPTDLATDQENELQMSWPYSMVLQHSQSWHGWTGVWVTSPDIRDQPLDLLTDKTELTLKSAGNVLLTFEYSAPGGIKEVQTKWVSIQADQTAPVFVSVPIPTLPVSEDKAAPVNAGSK